MNEIIDVVDAAVHDLNGVFMFAAVGMGADTGSDIYYSVVVAGMGT